MWSDVRQFFDSTTLSPHGICLLWRPQLIWAHAVSDAIIGLAYFSIPLALASFVVQRRDLRFSWMFWSFAAFILACGTTHFLAIWTLWVPDYGIEALVKVMTAAISLITACALWHLLPQLVALPSNAQLEAINETLLSRVAERDKALAALTLANAERDKVEAMFRQSQKMEAIGKLTGGLAHDINNLLNVVVANLERVERRLPPDRVIRNAVADAMTGAERAAAVVHNLLAFARQQPLQNRIVAINAIVSETLAMAQPSIQNGITLETRLATELWPVSVDLGQFQNALLNLLFNARDAMAESGSITITTQNVGSGHAELPASLDPAGDYVAVTVTDTGTGIPVDVLPQVFDPFFTTKPLGQGTGLGLSQVIGFVRQSGGDAVVQSKQNEGSRFTLYLPRHAEARHHETVAWGQAVTSR